MKKYTNIAIFLVAFLALFIVAICSVYNFAIGPVSKSTDEKEIVIKEGDTYMTIATTLKEQGLIRSVNFYKFYVKLDKPEELQAGSYHLTPSMGVKKIIEALEKGSTQSGEEITITFKEGLHMRAIADTIATHTNHTTDEFFQVLNDHDYLDQLITKYWFLTDKIKDSKIYYSLEGYLYPDTYQFLNKDVTVKEIIEAMLSQMEKQLEPYKTTIKKSNRSFHDILTIASISELEAVTEQDREQVARIFYNRLEEHMSLGSDVTTYYAAKVDMGERDLYQSELDDYNAYNTRNANMAGKLPIGPVSNPSIIAIKTAIDPASNNYLYFVSDKNRKLYFMKTYQEHEAKVSELIENGLWYTYE